MEWSHASKGLIPTVSGNLSDARCNYIYSEASFIYSRRSTEKGDISFQNFIFFAPISQQFHFELCAQLVSFPKSRNWITKQHLISWEEISICFSLDISGYWLRGEFWWSYTCKQSLPTQQGRWLSRSLSRKMDEFTWAAGLAVVLV